MDKVIASITPQEIQQDHGVFHCIGCDTIAYGGKACACERDQELAGAHADVGVGVVEGDG